MKPKRLNAISLKKVVNDIKEGREKTVGIFLYKGLRIHVSRYNLSTSQRVSALYHRRRRQGLCIQCGKRVRLKNQRTRKLYRLCEYHRKKIDLA